MARTQTLSGGDLKVKRPQTESGGRQRGGRPSADLVPIQFKLPADLVYQFKQEALNRRIKLNALFELAFQALLKS